MAVIGAPTSVAADDVETDAIGDVPCRADQDPAEGTRTITRSIEDWYGSVLDGSTKVLDSTQLSAFINDDVQAAIQGDASLDARAKAVAPFNTQSNSGIEWVLEANPPVLPAQSTLVYTLTTGTGATMQDFVQIHGPVDYLLGSFETVETAPVLVGPVENPTLCGSDGQEITITNDFVLRVTYFEWNATTQPQAVPPPAPTVTPNFTG
jgi:hypothetical protein